MINIDELYHKLRKIKKGLPVYPCNPFLKFYNFFYSALITKNL